MSRTYAPIASAAGCTVVDNSSAFRMNADVPLVVPEVNAAAMAHVKLGRGGIIANPNCSTIIALMAVTPLHRRSPVARMVVSTYQAASGAGAAAMAELETQTREALAGLPITKKIFKQQVRNSSLAREWAPPPLARDASRSREEEKPKYYYVWTSERPGEAPGRAEARIGSF